VLLVYGIYNFRPKRVAFRNDYCLFCARPRRAVQMRTFDVVHLFWIPLIPLGFRRRWRCTACRRSPHVPRGTRPAVAWAFLAVLVILGVAVWMIPWAPHERIFEWLMRVAMPVFAIFTLVHILRVPRGPSLKEKLAVISPAVDTVCPFCGSALLVLSSRGSCPVCGVVRV
jgi:hypothetical protein